MLKLWTAWALIGAGGLCVGVALVVGGDATLCLIGVAVAPLLESVEPVAITVPIDPGKAAAMPEGHAEVDVGRACSCKPP